MSHGFDFANAKSHKKKESRYIFRIRVTIFIVIGEIKMKTLKKLLTLAALVLFAMTLT